MNLRVLLEELPVAALALSADGRVAAANLPAALLFGRPPHALVGLDVRTLVSARDGNRLGWRLDQAAGPALGLAVTATGPRHVELRLAAPHAGEALFGPLYLLADGVDRGLGADELAHRAEVLELLLDELPVMVFSSDERGRCTWVSRAVERILGYTPEEIYALDGDFTRLSIDEPPAEWQRRTPAGTRDFRQRRKDGREVVMRYHVRRVFDGTGKLARMDGLGIDVTAERETERQLHTADRLAALGLLVAGIGHEINNPAAFVSLGVQQIERLVHKARESPDEVRGLLDKMVPILDDVIAGVHRIGDIVGELRLFARNPAAEGSVPTDLNQVVRAAASLVQAELRNRARLVVELGDLPLVPGSWTRLSQVVLNLLVNASQAIAPGQPDRHQVTVSTRLDDGRVIIRVGDTGRGIAPADRDRIFDPFFTTKPPGEGTGLGLSISYDIVLRLGGTMQVESEPGRGSTFTVSLPYLLPTRAGARDTAAAPGSGCVLVVDDERPLASAIARELSSKLQVRLVHTGGEALAALEHQRYDAVLCDLRMPGLSGIEVYEQTRARDRGQAERFVFLTGAGTAAESATFLRATGRPVLEKPFAMSELWRLVGSVVRAPGP